MHELILCSLKDACDLVARAVYMALSSWHRGSVYDAAWLLASYECTQTHLLSGKQFVLSSDMMQVICMALGRQAHCSARAVSWQAIKQ